MIDDLSSTEEEAVVNDKSSRRTRSTSTSSKRRRVDPISVQSIDDVDDISVVETTSFNVLTHVPLSLFGEGGLFDVSDSRIVQTLVDAQLHYPVHFSRDTERKNNGNQNETITSTTSRQEKTDKITTPQYEKISFTSVSDALSPRVCGTPEEKYRCLLEQVNKIALPSTLQVACTFADQTLSF